MQLSDAITAVENAATSYQAATTTTQNDQAQADSIKAKLDAATAQVATDQQQQTAAAVAFNSALDTLIQTATDAKISVPAATVAVAAQA